MHNFVEEINPNTYNPNIYYSSLDPSLRSSSRVNKKTNVATTSRSIKRVNYSLADLEAKLYQQESQPDQQSTTGTIDNSKKSGGVYLDKFSQQELIQSNRRFMELDCENTSSQFEIPLLMSSITGIPRDKIESASTSHARKETSSFKMEIPKNIQLMYNSTKPAQQKRKNTNRLVALKRVLAAKRPLHSYVETLDLIDKSIIYRNVYNRKYFKVLPNVIICSMCGGVEGLAGCVKCGEKVCSISCSTLHNETRCALR